MLDVDSPPPRSPFDNADTTAHDLVQFRSAVRIATIATGAHAQILDSNKPMSGTARPASTDSTRPTSPSPIAVIRNLIFVVPDRPATGDRGSTPTLHASPFGHKRRMPQLHERVEPPKIDTDDRVSLALGDRASADPRPLRRRD